MGVGHDTTSTTSTVNTRDDSYPYSGHGNASWREREHGTSGKRAYIPLEDDERDMRGLAQGEGGIIKTVDIEMTSQQRLTRPESRRT